MEVTLKNAKKILKKYQNCSHFIKENLVNGLSADGNRQHMIGVYGALFAPHIIDGRTVEHALCVTEIIAFFCFQNF